MARSRQPHYPLPSTYFACPPLSKKEEAHFVNLGEQSLRLFVENALNPIDMSWTSHGEHGGMRVFEGPPDRRNKNLVPHRAMSTIHGTLKEVAMLHAYETRELCLHHVARFKASSSSSHHLLDLIPLYNFVERTEDTPLRQTYVMWRAVSVSNVPMVKDRDFLYLESQDEFTLEDGRRGWAYCQHSIALPSCPPQALSAMSLLRGSFYHTGCIFMESVDYPGVLDVRGHFAIDFKGSMPMWLRRLCIQKQAAQIGKLEQHVHEFRLTAVPIRSIDDCESVLPKQCSLCTRSLSKLFALSTTSSPKQHCCQVCGLVVCTRCNQRWQRQDEVINVCINCSKHIRHRESMGWQVYSTRGGRDSVGTMVLNRPSRSRMLLSITAPTPTPHSHPRSVLPVVTLGQGDHGVTHRSTHPPNATETMDMTAFVERQTRVREAKRERIRQAMYNELPPGMDRFVALDTVRSDHTVNTRLHDSIVKVHDLLEQQSHLSDNEVDSTKDSHDQDRSVVLLDSVAVTSDHVAHLLSTRDVPSRAITAEPTHSLGHGSCASSLSSLDSTISYVEEPHDKSNVHLVLPAVDAYDRNDAPSLSRLVSQVFQA
ncbi:hypothetical protein H310_05350 [Aphanomyces invadans]|uniref:FYVE-type domain-containing protein n=1 Tax=Aphanomyces invadans TaxID=157072 RepID=A0A024UB82_9STRA|nr:hypothetical protein H310_05350 [Aphanomyces invadans]ETW02878.1 hypothetical protein H310_05350 [Aphanomyces invadans]|eukprot:XP_008868262.1 hypothetical protein H310_05350 [Aphanomyces invadans]